VTSSSRLCNATRNVNACLCDLLRKVCVVVMFRGFLNGQMVLYCRAEIAAAFRVQLFSSFLDKKVAAFSGSGHLSVLCWPAHRDNCELSRCATFSNGFGGSSRSLRGQYSRVRVKLSTQSHHDETRTGPNRGRMNF